MNTIYHKMTERTVTEYVLPTRLDDEYTRIKFEKYAYTHCITYELARRNKNVQNTFNFLIDLFAYYDQIISPVLTKYEKVIIPDDMLEKINNLENIFKKKFIDMSAHYDKQELINNFENLTFENIKEKIIDIINTLTEELYDKYYIIYQYASKNDSNDFHELYNPSKYLIRDKALTEYANKRDEKSKNNYVNNKYFTIYQDIKEGHENFSFNTIYPNFITPIRDFTDTKVLLNLSLPKEEIIDYIEKIKDNYDSENSSIKTFRELLEEELNIFNHDSNIMKSEKFVDILFIYDYYQMSLIYNDKDEDKIIYKTVEKIQIELTKYHGLKIKKTPNEIKNKKDTKYKQVSWDKYLEDNPETKETNICFGKNEKAYLSIKQIKDVYNTIKDYIEGDNPRYKTLIQ